MANMIAEGIDNDGFSFIEAMVQCPTAFGRKNRMGSPADMLKWMRDHAVMKAAWDKLPEESARTSSRLAASIRRRPSTTMPHTTRSSNVRGGAHK